MTIRLATQEDYDRLAPIAALSDWSPVTPAILREHDAKDHAPFARRWLAEVGGEVVGYGRALRRFSDEEGRFNVIVSVVPEHRGKGIGAGLYAETVTFSRSQGATFLTSKVRDDDPSSFDVALHFGFVETRREFESGLDPANVNLSPYDDLLARLEQEGFRFVSYADTDRSEAVQRMLHRTNCISGADAPGHEDALNWSFEQFTKDVFQAHWFRPEGQILAMFGDEAVGLGAVGEMSPGRFYNCFTGVLRDYRGRGIATALKVLTTRVAIDLGAKEICTNNASTNDPMLAINRKLGYVQRPGWRMLRKDLI